MRSSWRRAALTLFLLAVVAGGLFGDRLVALTSDTRDLLRVYTDLVEAARRSAGREVTYDDLVGASIDGMLRGLDPHTSFLPAEAYSTMRDRQQSSFSGLGILVGIRDGSLTVITPIEGTPASRLGIQAGDIIQTIEGEPTDAMSLDDAVRRLKGPKGTDVNIEIVRRGLEEPLAVTITRDEIPQTTVRYVGMIADGVGYMAVTDFNRGTGKEVEEALGQLRAMGMEKLLVDLRANGGGLLDQAIEVAEQFLPAAARIVETRGRTQDSFQTFAASDREGGLDLPVIVLVSEATASAAEILAGAIQDHDMGLIVGKPTWGKGLVQTVYSLSYGNGLALTTARYYTPAGRLIQRDYSSWYEYTSYSNGSDGADEPPDEEKFLTDLGRAVYGGGGITPDVLVEPRQLAPFVQFLTARAAFIAFAVDNGDAFGDVDPSWTPPEGLLDRFVDWAVAEDFATRERFDEAFADTEVRRDTLRAIHAEFVNRHQGIEAAYWVRAEGDPQIQRALELFTDAGALLAERRELDRSQVLN